jgi:hypothetical protein
VQKSTSAEEYLQSIWKAYRLELSVAHEAEK